MGHSHEVIDTDVRFHIDPYTRSFTDTTPAKKTIVQYDHNSERYTFDMPRYIEGHDIMLCNVVEVIFTNVDKSTKEQNDGPEPIADLHVSSEDEDTVVFSWLITRASTQLIGPLQFSIHFACKEEDGTITYEWNTVKFTKIQVKSGMNNRGTIDYLNELIEDAIEKRGLEAPITSYILVDEDGNEIAASVLVDEEITLTATANDIRINKTAITNDGLTIGEKVIPAYHTNQGAVIIPAGSAYKIVSLNESDAYDFTKLQAIICDYNTTISDSVSANKIAIDDKVYAVQSVEFLSELFKNDDEKTIDFGITNETDNPQVLRYFTYKEIY